MASYGSLGGLGGSAMSFPMRGNQPPTSQAVDYLAGRNQWETDFGGRWDAMMSERAKLEQQQRTNMDAMSRANSSSSAPPAPPPSYSLAQGPGGLESSFSDYQSYRDSFQPQVVSGPSHAEMFASLGLDPMGTSGQSGAGGPPVIGGSALSGPRPAAPVSAYQPVDFSRIDARKAELEAERGRLLPMYENQTRQQQAYDSMRGWGQENAVMGPNYQEANFGQISGDPNGGMGASPLSGVNGTQSGVYSAGGTTAGVYGAPRRSNWGL
jgi:hypothetical protein